MEGVGRVRVSIRELGQEYARAKGRNGYQNSEQTSGGMGRYIPVHLSSTRTTWPTTYPIPALRDWAGH